LRADRACQQRREDEDVCKAASIGTFRHAPKQRTAQIVSKS
jgi:hypothetical protein